MPNSYHQTQRKTTAPKRNGVESLPPPIHRDSRALPSITVSAPYPLLDPGRYVARCTEATHAWARQWKKHIARLVLAPQNYTGKPYTGDLCAFLGLGRNLERPFAGQHSKFRKLFVEVNGAQPTNTEVSPDSFVGYLYDIEVETVTLDRHGKPRPPETWYSIAREIHLHGRFPETDAEPFNPKPANPLTQGTQVTHSTDQHSNTVNTPLAEQSVTLAGQLLFRRRRNRDELG